MVIDKKRRCAVDKSTKFPSDESGELFTKTVLTEGNNDLAVVVLVYARELYYFKADGVEKMTGYLKFKIEQLKLLGFLPVVVSDWTIHSLKTHSEYVLT